MNSESNLCELINLYKEMTVVKEKDHTFKMKELVQKIIEQNFH